MRRTRVSRDVNEERSTALVLLAQGNAARERFDDTLANTYYAAARAADPTFISAEVALCLLEESPHRRDADLDRLRERIEESDGPRIARKKSKHRHRWDVDWYRIAHTQAGAALNKVSERTNTDWLDKLKDIDDRDPARRLAELARRQGDPIDLQREIERATERVAALLDAVSELDKPQYRLKPRYPRWFISRRRRDRLERYAVVKFVRNEVKPAAEVLDSACTLVTKQLAAIELARSKDDASLAKALDDWRTASTPDKRFELKGVSRSSYRVCYNRSCLWARAAIPVHEEDAAYRAETSLGWLTQAIARADGYVVKWMSTYAPNDPALLPLRRAREDEFDKLFK